MAKALLCVVATGVSAHVRRSDIEFYTEASKANLLNMDRTADMDGEDVYIARMVGTSVNGHNLMGPTGSAVSLVYNRTTHAEAQAKGVYRQSAASHPITDLASCLFACRHDERCVGFVDHFEDADNTHCELKTSLQMEFTDRGATTDVYVIPMDGFINQNGIDFPGGDIRNMDGAPSATASHPARRYYNASGLKNPQASCAIACIQDVTCLGFIDVHHGETGRLGDEPFCLLKDSLNATCCENNYTHMATNFYRKSLAHAVDAALAIGQSGQEDHDHNGKQDHTAAQHDQQQAVQQADTRMEEAAVMTAPKHTTHEQGAHKHTHKHSHAHTLLAGTLHTSTAATQHARFVLK